MSPWHQCIHASGANDEASFFDGFPKQGVRVEAQIDTTKKMEHRQWRYG